MFLFKQKTAYEMRISDWSSDVCSSDLGVRRSADALGAGAFAIQMDVTRQASIDAGFAEAIGALGKLDILINNAALFTAAPIAEITRADYARVLAVNTAGRFL